MKKLIISVILISAAMFSLENAAASNNTMTVANNDSPSGLQGKGGAEHPKGLEKHEKSPHGWSHGKKHGWDHHANHHRDHHNNHGHHNDKAHHEHQNNNH